jgi:hypothetical protein
MVVLVLKFGSIIMINYFNLGNFRLGSSVVEHRTENPCVGGSIPPLNIFKIFIHKNGDNGTRTHNRMLAKHVFYQLKYIFI